MNETNLKNVTVVITGPTSGIGKAAALCFAKEGANVVLASRNEPVLQELANECIAFGGNAVALQTDVTDKESVKDLMKNALSYFGKIDVWINNAGVGAVGEFTQTPLEVHEQVIRTNLLGPLYGSYYVLQYFIEQQRGTIINTNSTGAYVGSPFSVGYSASKFGFRGLSEALRYEMKRYPNIHICDIFAAFVDSPGMHHAANYMGKELKPAPPLVDPVTVAQTMVALAKKPKDMVRLGASDMAARFAHTLMPNFMGQIMGRLESSYFKKAKKVPVTDGNLFTPTKKDTHIRGGFS
ncbi:MAG TPA: SDR family oxidoreductase [Bacteriovoracaceae bacterium]|nr:SDR family oxidoreductase [Bacteriovoracaceae bacterium]